MSATTFNVPGTVAQAVVERWPTQGRLWTQSVNSELADLCRRYHAVPTAVMSARYSFVVAVQTIDRPLILRATPDPDGENQVKVARVFAKLDVGPTIHEVIRTESGIWTVMARVQPGTNLWETPTTSRTLSALIRLLWSLRNQPAPPGLPHLDAWLRERLEDDNLSDRAPGRSVAPRDQRERALSILEELESGPGDALCHGDASYGNILHGRKDQLFFIDPRGVCGDVAYDAAVISLKTAHYLPPSKVVDMLATGLHLDGGRVRRWMAVANAARV